MTRYPAKSIIHAVSWACSVPIEAMLSTDRHRPVAYARIMAVYVMRRHTKLSYKKIGILLGGRHHATTMYAFKRFPALIGRDKKRSWGDKSWFAKMRKNYWRAHEILASEALGAIAHDIKTLNSERAEEALPTPTKALTKPADKEQVNG